jgi:hypothetical protein
MRQHKSGQGDFDGAGEDVQEKLMTMTANGAVSDGQ